MKQTALFHPGYNAGTITLPTVTSVSAVSQYPQEVKDGFKAKILDSPGGSSLNTQDVLAEQIEI